MIVNRINSKDLSDKEKNAQYGDHPAGHPGLAAVSHRACTPVWDNIPTPPPTAATPQPDAAPIIVDDDGSIDGLIALLYLLSDPAFDVQAVTVSYGEAHPEIYAPLMQQFLARLGKARYPGGCRPLYPPGKLVFKRTYKYA